MHSGSASKLWVISLNDFSWLCVYIYGCDATRDLRKLQQQQQLQHRFPAIIKVQSQTG